MFWTCCGSQSNIEEELGERVCASRDACLRGILNVYVCGAKYNEARTVKRKGPLKLIELKGNLIRG